MSKGETYIASAKPLAVFVGRCDPCDRPVRTTTDLFAGDHYPVPCPDCGKFADCQRLYATTSKMVCDGRCMSAYGKVCDCACGGANHAGVWEKRGEMVADYLAIYRRDREQRAVRAKKATETRANAKATRLRAEFDSWAGEHAELIAELTGTSWRTHQFPNDFLGDMADLVNREEPLTEPQVMRAVSILDRRRAVAERIAQERAEREAREAARAEQSGTLFVVVPSERRFIEGPILEAWTYDGDWGVTYKIKVDCGDFTAVGTLPRNLETEALPQPYSGEDWRALRHTLPGRRVKLKATLKPRNGHVGEGYFSRPSNAEFLEVPAAT